MGLLAVLLVILVLPWLSLSGLKWFGAVTPLGGLAFLAGWACMAWAAWKA